MVELRLLNFDDDPRTEVILKGRTFWIEQQAKATLDRIVLLMYPENPAAAEEKDDDPNFLQKLAMMSLEKFDGQFEAFGLILGLDPADPGFSGECEFLRKNLSWSRARRIFETWFTINDVQSFLSRRGDCLLPQAHLDRIATMTDAEVLDIREQVEERLAERAAATEASENAPS